MPLWLTEILILRRFLDHFDTNAVILLGCGPLDIMAMSPVPSAPND